MIPHHHHYQAMNYPASAQHCPVANAADAPSIHFSLLLPHAHSADQPPSLSPLSGKIRLLPPQALPLALSLYEARRLAFTLRPLILPSTPLDFQLPTDFSPTPSVCPDLLISLFKAPSPRRRQSAHNASLLPHQLLRP